MREWRAELQKAALTKLQTSLLRISPKAAKHNVDQLLEGQPVTLHIAGAATGATFVAEARALGADCQLWPAGARQLAASRLCKD